MLSSGDTSGVQYECCDSDILVLVTQILYAAMVKMVLIVNVTIMACHEIVLLLVYATMLNVYIEPVIVIACHVTVYSAVCKESVDGTEDMLSQIAED